MVFWLHLKHKKDLKKTLKNNRAINNRLSKLEKGVSKVPFFKKKI